MSGRGDVEFFPRNSTCQFCDSIRFVQFKKPLLGLGELKEVTIASNPEEWFSGLRKHDALDMRLVRIPRNDPGISDRMSAGFVGGGGTWLIEVLRSSGRSEFWGARWLVGNQNAPDKRIWKVTYGLVRKSQTVEYKGRSLSDVKRDLRSSLETIRAFSQRESCDGFAKCFSDALEALDNPEADIGYHKDLTVPGQLNPEATSMLKASMNAWVFGGMGSWNDIGFDGAKQPEYEAVSENLFNFLNDAIEVATTSSATGQGS